MNISVNTSDTKVRRWHAIAGLCLFHGYRKGAELGVSTGRFTMFLCATMPDMRMTAVDLWAEQPQNSEDGGSQNYVGWNHEAHYELFKANCKTFFGKRVTIHRMDTVAAADLVEDGSLDFVFVDALHTYDGCKRDIEAWYPKVRKGGMICGHDYNYKWPGVLRAVTETGWAIQQAPDSVWVHLKR